MKLGDWYSEVIRQEFPIVLDIVRNRCVYTWTIADFVEVWSQVGTFPISNGKANRLLHEIEKFGIITCELVKGEKQYR